MGRSATRVISLSVNAESAPVKDYDKAMSTAELLEHVRALPARERRKLVEMILELEEDSMATPTSPRRIKWPDIQTRAKRIFGNKIMPNLVLMERGESPF